MAVDYKKFIEEQFLIKNRYDKIVPFHLFPVQKKYCQVLKGDYGREFKGVREIILKARQEGFSSLILALFTVDFITLPNSISICISHRKKDTKVLFQKVQFFLDSYCQKHGWDVKQYLATDNKNEMENSTNGASFYIATAGAKVGGRGGTVKNILFSEAASYPDTEKITAREIVEGTSQQVAQDYGMIFIESTAKGFGNYYQHVWEKAMRGESNYQPRFFSWEEFYTEEWVEKKKGDFESEAMWKQEYPKTAREAFISSGTPFFDRKVLEKLLDSVPKAIKEGRLAQDGQWL